MLSPRDRRLLLEALRPPRGYALDRAIGTSYSLDLLALLTAPLAFTFFDWEDADGRPTADPLALLQAVRRHARRIHLFCQAGEIHVPPPGKPLLGYLERSIVQVEAPDPAGVFHPKVWVLRYVAEGEPVRHRVLCLSRNLTLDRSWDTALVLDGELRTRRNAFARNRPLSDFLAALPGLGLDTPDEARRSAELLADELRRVDFELPPPFEDLAFHPLGLPGSAWPFPASRRRMLVMSPFVSDGFLRLLTEGRRGAFLVSRPESLSALRPETLALFDSLHVLAEEANVEEQDEDSPEQPEAAKDAGKELLSGLHAKLFVQDDGWNAHVWTGSANATSAAFERNVELLVQLTGKKSRCGIRGLLGDGEDDEGTLGELLEEWKPPPSPPERPPELERVLEQALRDAKRALSRGGLELHAEPREDDCWALLLRSGESAPLPEGILARCWPATLRAERSQALSPGATPPSWDPVSFEALTAFLAIELTATREGATLASRFVLRVPLVGAPDDREQRLVLSLLRDRDQVLRLLWILLAHEEICVQALAELGSGGRGSDGWRGGSDGILPLLEPMLRALDRDPRALDEVERLILDLSRTEEGRALLPEGFEEIWKPILQVRRALA